jgi:hypothetical protein
MAAMSRTYTVDAKRWEHGWELHVEGVGVTQSKSLHSAASVAREYISLAEDISDESTIDVEKWVRRRATIAADRTIAHIRASSRGQVGT